MAIGVVPLANPSTALTVDAFDVQGRRVLCLAGETCPAGVPRLAGRSA